jgi:heptaprenyl diphosphate synthase
MQNYWEQFPTIQVELQRVHDLMLQETMDAEPFISQPLIKLIQTGGKKMRPAFVLIAGNYGNPDPKRIQAIAASIELLHLSTLIHDDIIDQSKLRRGIEAVPSKYGTDVAVYLGDYLFAKTFLIMSRYQKEDSNTEIAKAIFKICRGELKQYRFRHDTALSVSQYLRVISGKTAALFSVSLYAGAIEGDLSHRKAHQLALSGLRAGMAFQIIDDCLDYTSEDKNLSKSAQNDIKQGFMTLPIIYALKADSTGQLQKRLNESSLSKADLTWIQNQVITLGGVKKAQVLAKKYTKKAYEALNRTPDCESRAILHTIYQSLLERRY